MRSLQVFVSFFPLSLIALQILPYCYDGQNWFCHVFDSLPSGDSRREEKSLNDLFRSVECICRCSYCFRNLQGLLVRFSIWHRTQSHVEQRKQFCAVLLVKVKISSFDECRLWRSFLAVCRMRERTASDGIRWNGNIQWLECDGR